MRACVEIVIVDTGAPVACSGAGKRRKEEEEEGEKGMGLARTGSCFFFLIFNNKN